jgi:acyl-CoA thioester hydrolase
MTDHTELTPSFWGSVNTWECDENDHQNVRFFAHKINQALQAWIADLTGAAGMTLQVPGAIRQQHIRFVREARAATPVRVDCGLLRHTDGELTALSIMYHNASNEPLAAFQTTLDTRDWPDAWRAPAPLTAPAFAQPRGIDPARLPPCPPNCGAALAVGYRIVGQGVIGADECDRTGAVLPHVYIGRVSDGMPNLWVFVNGDADAAARADGTLGGAALEYHLAIHAPLREGDVYTHLSGVRAIAAKTQTMSHIIINGRSGACAASATAVGVAMDLTTRRAVAIAPARRARLERLLLGD